MSEVSLSNSHLNQYLQNMLDGKFQYAENSIGESLLEKIQSKTLRSKRNSSVEKLRKTALVTIDRN